ncbi:FAD-binding oxidoreductase [Amnibacterium sp.]|uniref:NAD(P)/FAD-dependent oxidoreductase n=1 Tax=Amnibacterium sp. TaxID=1872496 RepID=UPI002620DFA9|nr:FAD-dependent oxidoreductase [Amnibacterium sp.]MCU1472018.1 oxidoreductase [Amnibacterium sp.]
MSVRAFDVVVIGAGIAGAAVAYHAAARGLATAIIEAGRAGRATTAGAGIISNHGLRDDEFGREWLSLVRSSTAEYASLMAQLGEGAEQRSDYRVVGEVVLASTEDEQVELDRFQSASASPPIGTDKPDMHRLSGRDLRTDWPSIRDDLQGLFISTTARVDGNRLADLLVERAQAHGAVLLHGEARIEPGRHPTVRVGDDAFSAREVVVAAGIWTPRLVEPLGVRVVVVPDRGQIVHLSGGREAPAAPVLKSFGGPYVLGFSGPRIVVGATHETSEAPSADVRAGDQLEVLEQAFSVAPGLRAHTILETRVGFRPASVDGLPLVGRVDDRVSVLTGLGSWGLTLGPLLGRRLVDGMTGSDDPGGLDVSVFSPNRASVAV